jgi:hypothetical protein
VREVKLPLKASVGNRDRLAAFVVAEELVALTSAISDLAYDLGSDPETLRRHMGSLQSIDLITQIHLALAEFLRSSDSLEARVSNVTVEALADRLREKLERGAEIGRAPIAATF